MDTLKSVIFISCVCGVAGVIMDFVVPEATSKKQFGFLLGMVTVLAVISPFTLKGFEISDVRINKNISSQDISGMLENKSTEVILRQSEEKLNEYFTDKLNRNGIKADVNVTLEITKDNEVKISTVKIKGENCHSQKCTELICEDAGECEISFSGDE